eukprot:1920555-Prorocentrum_lima.AAC.1
MYITTIATPPTQSRLSNLVEEAKALKRVEGVEGKRTACTSLDIDYLAESAARSERKVPVTESASR